MSDGPETLVQDASSLARGSDAPPDRWGAPAPNADPLPPDARPAHAERLCSAAMRASIGGCDEKSAAQPGLSVMPEAAID